MNACPAGAIVMRPDEAGFLYPAVDGILCRDCGACSSACPRLHPSYGNESPGGCLAVMADDETRRKSSSGGVFTLLAEYVLALDGMVAGAAFGDGFLVRHAWADSVEGLDALRGSKYVQSDTGRTYAEAKRFLEDGRPVLYSGCACQVAGLKSFLGKEYDGLLTVDILCTGVPSPYGLRDYVDKTWGLYNVESVRFRDLEHWDYVFEAVLKSGETVRESPSAYLDLFLKKALNRPSCLDCQFQKMPRQGDFTLGDFWNVKGRDADMDDGLGTSVVTLNNAKARAVWEYVLASGRVKAWRAFSVNQAYDGGVAFLLHGPDRYPRQDRFDARVRERGYARAVRDEAVSYDVGLVGTWLNNFGTISTQWALYRTLKSLGLSVCVADVTGDADLDGSTGIAKRFMDAKGVARASASCQTGDFDALDDRCGAFVLGSDQLWGPFQTYCDHEEYVHLAFASEGKPLVAMGTSVGPQSVPWGLQALERRRKWLGRFSYIGVRDDYGPGLLREMYGVRASHVQDPVFLCGRSVLEAEKKNATFEPPKGCVFAYVLYKPADCPEIELARDAAKRLGVGLVVNRGLGTPFEVYDEDMKLVGRHDSYYRNWVACMSGAGFVVTNSFHGMAVSLVFEKEFIAIVHQGGDRLYSLGRDFDCVGRVFKDAEDADLGRVLAMPLDWRGIRAKKDSWRSYGLKALAAALAPVGAVLPEPAPVGGRAPLLAKGRGPVRSAARFRASAQADFQRFVRLGEPGKFDRALLPGGRYLSWLAGLPDPDVSSRILVEIPSYCDPQVVGTVLSARAMAANPERIRFAVCLQDDDADRLAALEAVEGCRVVRYAAADAPGACRARWDCQRLYSGEDFVFHTDAHMRFARYWDVALLAQWKACGDPKAVLTEYPAGLRREWLREPVDSDVFTEHVEPYGVMMAPFYFDCNTCELRAQHGKSFYSDRPVPGALMAAGYSFGPAAMDLDVPVDPNMDFAGDESAMSPRLWTHGYNFYHPTFRFVYHLYAPDTASDGDGTAVRKAPAAQRAGADGLTRGERQRRRLEKLLGMYDWPDVDLGEFGLGAERTLDAYQEFLGVDYRRLWMRAFSQKGGFGQEHDGAGMEYYDWVAASSDWYGGPSSKGRKLETKAASESVDRFMATCRRLHWLPEAALTEALRQWSDRQA